MTRKRNDAGVIAGAVLVGLAVIAVACLLWPADSWAPPGGVGVGVPTLTFKNIIAGGNTIAADGRSDSLTITAGDNVTIASSPTADSVTISASLGTGAGTGDFLADGSVPMTGAIQFEGATADAFELSLTVVDPTSDTTVTLQDATGTVALTSDLHNDESNADSVTVGVIETATISETNTGTSLILAVTPDSLDGWTGSTNVTTLGTIANGTWNATALTDAYIDETTLEAENLGNSGSTSGWVLATDGAGDSYWKADADSGGTPAISALGDAAAAFSIDLENYTFQLMNAGVEAFKMDSTDVFYAKGGFSSGVADGQRVVNAENTVAVGATASQGDIYSLSGVLKFSEAGAVGTTVALAGGAFHDGFSDFVAAEHIDWTADQGATNIDSGNVPLAATATALAANGANCNAGEIPLGVDASGAVESCYEPTEADITDLAHTATAITDGLIVEADLNADEAPTDNDILTYDTTGANFSWQTPAEIGLQPLDATLTDLAAAPLTEAGSIGDAALPDSATFSSTAITTATINALNLTGVCSTNAYQLIWNTDNSISCVVDATGGGGANLFETVAGDSGTDAVADATTDTLTLAGSTGISTAGSAASDTITWTLDSTLADISDGTINENLVNTANPWAVNEGGTGAATFTDGGVLLGSGTGPITAMAVLADSTLIVGDGTTDPVAESGATLRTSIGIGTGDTPQFTGIEVGAATDTSLLRASAGDVAIEGNIVYRAGGTDVPATDGGTGASSLTDGGLLLGSGAGPITALGVASNGQIPVGDGTTDPVLATISGTANEIEITNGAGTITVGIVTNPTLGGANFSSIPGTALNSTVTLDTELTAGTVDWATTGTINGLVNVTSTTAATLTLTAATCASDMHVNGDNDVIDYTLPTAAAGQNCAFMTPFNAIMTVDTANTGDSIILDGTTLTAGNAVDSAASAGSYAYFMAISASQWVIVGSIKTWSDGGAD